MIDKATQTDLYILISLILFFIEREAVIEVAFFIIEMFFLLMSL